MSDLATAARLRQATSQLPAAWYCDPRVFEAEHRQLFARAPGYVGHELMVPEAGDYHVLAARDDAQALVARPAGRRAAVQHLPPPPGDHADRQGQRAEHRVPDPPLDLRPPGQAARRAAFRRQALPQSRPHAAAELERAAVRRPARRRARSRRPRAAGPRLLRATCSIASTCTSATYNWKTFIEVYLEDYHVEPFHPGLGQFVTCDDLRWEFADWASVQFVGVNNGLAKPGTRNLRALAQGRARLLPRRLPPHGAIWLTYYPNIMVEWYPHVLIVSTLIPKAVDRTLQHRRVLLSRGHRAVRARVRRGRAGGVPRDRDARTTKSPSGWMPAAARCTAQGRSEVGPYQSPMEDGMQHFHEFYRREMDVAPRRADFAYAGPPSGAAPG